MRLENNFQNLSGLQLEEKQINMLQALAAYMQQIKLLKVRAQAADALVANPEIAKELVNLFNFKFDTANNDKSQAEQSAKALQDLIAKVGDGEQKAILENYLVVLQAIIRTNYFTKTAEGADKEYVSFKIQSRKIENMPLPKPLFEVFVFSEYMEGVHLRGGKIGRGGIRWSNRPADFRSEILSLVKAQQVKNTVIVPVGSKGGFIVTKESDSTDSFTHGKECYKTLLRGMLDVTDNLVNDKVVAPVDVVRLDEDDPYLAVAADKGTATFSDMANGISQDYGFWLGDAFASGGSNGYDHKGLGITSRGGWESVKRHFRELGVDCQTQEFTAIGTGSMYGDVFGNGVLLSEKMKLIAAFNSKHIFLDPNPNIEASYKERQRLAKLEDGTSWDEYDTSLISQGGGVYSKNAEFIELSSEIKQALGIDANVEKLTPDELVRSILQAPVDLWWNGGIGTYVKASDETNEEAGDLNMVKYRIDANQLRCKVIGEGANLALTQRARIEAALNGVRLYTDFIDNVGGVNCSDHEVNLKIMFEKMMQKGTMSLEERNTFMPTMDDDVANLVIADSRRQGTALAVARLDASKNLSEFKNLVDYLEVKSDLNREVEFLPTAAEFDKRQADSTYLTAPELGVILAYTKAKFKVDMLELESLMDKADFEMYLAKGFPKVIFERYRDELLQHPLKYNLITTMFANEFIDYNGITLSYDLTQKQGLKLADIIQTYLVVRKVFDLPALWQSITALDYKVDAAWQIENRYKLGKFVQGAIAWYLNNGKTEVDLTALLSDLSVNAKGDFEKLPESAAKIFANLDSLMAKLA